jgi:shikimate dehydrogenase
MNDGRPPALDGNTRIYAILGDPVAPVRSPPVFNDYFVRRGVNAVFIPLHVTAADLPAAFAGIKRMRNVAGLVATMPHKAAMARLVDVMTDEAARVEAVNTARRGADGRWEGTMTDGIGFVRGLATAHRSPRGMRTLLNGNGGVGRAIAFALAAEGVVRLTLHDREHERAEKLAGDLRRHFPRLPVMCGSTDPDDQELLINATPLGLNPEDDLPFDVARFTGKEFAADVVNKPEFTRFLIAARARGCPIATGRHLHEGQAIDAAEFLGLKDWP